MEKSYEDDLILIDKYSLDVEWEKLPGLYDKWAREFVEAEYERDKAKEQLDVVRAEIDTEIRKRIGEGKSNKMTEAAISNTIILNKRYQQASNNYIDSVKAAKILDIARRSFENKKKSLERLTDLFLVGYWAEPRMATLNKREIEADTASKTRRQFSDRSPKNR